MNPIVKWIGGAFAVFLLLTIFIGGSYYTVPPGWSAVVVRMGKITGVEAPGSGLGFKMPFLSTVKYFNVQSQAEVYDQMESYSQDQQPANFKVSVRYHISAGDVEQIYNDYGSEDAMVSRLLDRIVPQQVKTTFGQFSAVTAIADRAKLNAAVQSAVETAITGPVVIEGVQVEDVKFSVAYENAVEQRMQAQVQVQKMEQEADQQEVQAKITVINAQAAADAQVAQATAQAKATELNGNATAAAIKARGDALKANPDLVELTAAERWNGVLPTTMVPGSTVPFVSIGTASHP